MNTKEIREAAEATIKAEASADVLRSVGAESNMYAPWRPPVCIAMEAQKVLALCDAADGNAWRPIESAPRDGTWVLLYGTCAYPSVDEGQQYPVLGYWTDLHGGGWVWYGPSMNFTHWMPLPNPPEADDDE